MLSGVSNIVTVRFQSADVVRHKLVQAIVEAYEGDATRQREAVQAGTASPA